LVLPRGGRCAPFAFGRERSCGDRRAAEQPDELAPSQLIELHSVPSQGWIAEYRISEDQATTARPREGRSGKTDHHEMAVTDQIVSPA
jgi:hypothetical protein